MSEVAVMRPSGSEVIEAVITKGDLSKLTPGEKTQYYAEVCRSVGLNPFTRPFEYISLSGKLTLYARREATDQLRRLNGISLEVLSRDVSGDILTVHVRARDKSGRVDEDFGAVSLKGLAGEALANANMRAITKGKRRVTLSISGLGFLDESEVEDIPRHERAAPQDTRAALDTFAAPAHTPDVSLPHAAVAAYDSETGEIHDVADTAPELAARAAASRGTEALRSHLRGLHRAERELLAPLVGTAAAPGPILLLAQRTDQALQDAGPPHDDGLTEPFGLPPSPDESPSQSPGRPGRLHVRLQDETSDGWTAWERAMWALIEAGDDKSAILRDNKINLGIYEQLDPMAHSKLMRALGG